MVRHHDALMPGYRLACPARDPITSSALIVVMTIGSTLPYGTVRDCTVYSADRKGAYSLPACPSCARVSAATAAADLPRPNASACWPRWPRNGARPGTPYFVGPDARPDARINRFWREPGIRGRAEATLRRYAFSVKVWLNFLEDYGVPWDQAGPHCLAAFKEWRMSAEANGERVQAGSFTSCDASSNCDTQPPATTGTIT